MEPRCRIELLGGLRLLVDGRTITRFRSQKTATLLAYLAYPRGGVHTREALLELLWPGEDLDAARNSLRVALSSLRRQLEPPDAGAGGLLRADRATVGLDPQGYVTDVEEFEAALAAARGGPPVAALSALEEAVRLYQGELLPGCYAEWVFPERRRLALEYVGALRRLGELLETVGKPEQALVYALRAAAADPADEEAQRDLIRLYLQLGRPREAREAYVRFERWLRDEFGAAPSPETVALATSLPGPPLSLPPRSSSSLHTFTAGAPVAGPPGPPGRGSAPPLPLPLNLFYGREAELERLRRLLAEPGTRLLTLFGPGGAGKTRLALEAVRRLDGDLPGRVWFIPLDGLRSGEQVLDAALRVVGLPAAPHREPLEELAAALSDAPAVLVLDNLEHLLPAAAPRVLALLHRLPRLRCVVTSRRRLALPGERLLPVPPLPVPGEGDSLDALLQVPSVQLFRDRAQGALPDFQVTPRNAEAVGRLCRALEGIPLAVELAAARAGTLTPHQMLERLDPRFPLLSRGRGRGHRHDSLWKAVQWSYDLLSPTLQRFFARLSVFRGGWSGEAARRVCEEPAALEYLEVLRSHSLVTAQASEDADPGMRFAMLETLREFGEAQLSPEEREQCRERHHAFYRRAAEVAAPRLLDGELDPWLPALEADQGNLDAALDYAAGTPEGTLPLAAALGHYWFLAGRYREGRRRLEQALEETGGPPAARASARMRLAAMLSSTDDPMQAAVHLEAAAELFRAQGDLAGQARCLMGLGVAEAEAWAPTRARRRYEEAEALFREAGDLRGLARCLNNHGNLLRHSGDWRGAGRYFEEAERLFRQTGDRMGLAAAVLVRGDMLMRAGDPGGALERYREGLSLWRGPADRRGVPYALDRVGCALLALGRVEEAACCWADSLRLWQELDYRGGMAGTLRYLVRAARLRGAYNEALGPLQEAAHLVST